MISVTIPLINRRFSSLLFVQGLPGPQGATGETGKPGEQVRVTGEL